MPLTNLLPTAVGRWQKGKDLTWYAKGDSDTALTPEQQRLAEIKRIKEVEQDALSEALGFKVVRRHTDAVDQDEVRRAIKESGVGDEPVGDGDKEESQGVGFGKGGRGAGGQLGKEDGKGATNDDGAGRVDTGYRAAGEKERPEGHGRLVKDRGGRRDRDRERDGHRRRHRSRSQSPSREKERERHRHRRGRDESQRRRHRKSRSASPRHHRDRRDHVDKNGRREGRGDRYRGEHRERDRARDDDREGRRRRRSKSPGRPKSS